MKSNELQIKIIDAIIECLHGWQDTNDIESPSIENDDYSYLMREFEDFVLDSEIKDIADTLESLLNSVRHIKGYEL